MDEVLKLYPIFEKLLPGLIAAFVFYGVTVYIKPSPFESIVQALIFTTIILPFISLTKYVAILLGHIVCMGNWTDETTMMWSIFYGVIIGLLFARCANFNTIHLWLYKWEWYEKLQKKRFFKWLPKWGFTKRTSYTSEWHSAFDSEQRYITLHLTGSRRIYGWALEWPNYPTEGHFILMEAKWLLDDGSEAPLFSTQKILIPAIDVEMIEFLKWDSEITVQEEERVKIFGKLVNLQKGAANGSTVADTKSSTTTNEFHKRHEFSAPTSTRNTRGE